VREEEKEVNPYIDNRKALIALIVLIGKVHPWRQPMAATNGG
jgi:hypothetical protein